MGDGSARTSSISRLISSPDSMTGSEMVWPTISGLDWKGNGLTGGSWDCIEGAETGCAGGSG